MVKIESPYHLRILQTGIRGLKIPWPKGRAGSIPASRTTYKRVFKPS